MTPTCFVRIIPLVRLAVLAALPGGGAWAQGITVDGRLSPAQTLAGPNYAIGAGLGRQVGANLFHSFGAFGLKQGETATFSGPASVGNVIGRVTGGAASSIDGGIKSTIPGANLYLINPAGMVFGPNASVDVSGSFHASSADSLRMQDGARFGATNPDASTLSAAPPEAFGFLSANPRPVAVNGSNLQLKQGGTQQGNTLGLVGGDVTISGGVLLAPGGTVHIASAAGPGEVPVDPRAGPAPTVARSGRVQVANKSFIRASGENGGTGGSVFVRAGDLSVSASDIGADNGGPGPGGVLSLHGDRTVTISNGATVRADANGAGRGADASIGTAAGGTVTLDAATVRTVAFAAGDSGTVAINTGALTLRNGAVMQSAATDRGNGGPISVAADSVLLDGTGTSFSSGTFGTGLAGAVGAGGRISLAGGTLSIQNRATIEANSFGTGPGGPISVAMTGNVAVATGSHILSGSNAGGASDPAAAAKGGDAGPISLNAGALTLLRGGAIRSVASGSGNASEVALNIGGALTIDATDFGGFPNGVSSETMQNSSGSASTVRVSAGSVSVLNGGFINGNTQGTGAAGSVVVATPGALLLDGGGMGGGSTEIGASARGGQSGAAGAVAVKAGTVTVQNGAVIDSNTAGLGRGGSVTVTTPGALLLDGQGVGGTGISAETLGLQSGDAGAVTVNAGSVAVQNGAQIASNTYGPGRGGDVTVNAGALTLLRGGSIRNVASRSGNAGEVALNVDGALTIDAADFGGFPNGVSSETAQNSSGSAGIVQVIAGSVSVRNGGFINGNAHGTGAGGPVVVATPGALLLDGGGGGSTEIGSSAAGGQSGNAGLVTVYAGRVTVQNGARIDSNTAGPGRGGDVTVATPGALLLDGQGVSSTGITAGATGPQSGTAGMVTVNAGSVAVQGGAQITSTTNGPSRGSDVTVNTGALTLLRGGVIRSVAFESGNAGDVALNVGGALTIDAANNNGLVNGVSSETAQNSSGSAGMVRVIAGSVSVLNGGFINSNTHSTGAGGSVVVATPGALLLDGGGGGNTEIGASAVGGSPGNAGTVMVSAGKVTVQNGAVIASNTAGPGRGGDVTVMTPGALLLDGQGVGGTGITAGATMLQSGDAGMVTVNAGSVAVQNGAQIASNTNGPGRGGDVTVTTPGALLLDGQGTIRGAAISAETLGPRSGDAGTITVNAGSVAVQGGGLITSSTAGSGRGGDVTVNTGALAVSGGSDVISVSFASASGNAGTIALKVGGALTVDAAQAGRFTNGVSSEAEPGSLGAAGTVTVNAGSVSVLNGGFINSSAGGTGAGGSVVVTTPGALLLDGRGQPGGPAEISASATQPQSGDAGSVTIRAGSVSVLNSGVITSNTQGTGRGGSVLVTTPGALLLDGRGDAATAISAETLGPRSGDAGTVTVSAGTVTIQGGAQVASNTTGPGRGGNVDVMAGSAIRLNGPGPQVAGTATSMGNAGSISVAAPQVFLRDGASISTAALGANGGNITIGPGDLLYLQRSAITTSVGGASGNGGNITVEPRLVVLDRSTIQANAVGGNGGNVRVQANQLVQSFDSAITASSQRGVSGQILFAAQPLNLNGSLVVLASDLRAAAALLREGCAVRGAAPRSSLVAAGRGGQRQGLEATLPALYFAHRPVRDDAATAAAPAADPPAAPERISLGLSSPCG